MPRFSLSAFGLAVCIVSAPAYGFDALNFDTPGMDEDLRSQLKSNAALTEAQADNRSAGADVLAAALSDYGILLETLYAAGYYGGTVSIRIDGREAADIALLSTPETVTRVDVTVTTGPKFKFGETNVAPVTPETEMPEGFKRGQTARAPLIGDAADAAIEGWRADGHAKAEIAAQRVTANHVDHLINVNLRVAPGPELRFGRLVTVNDSYVRTAALRRIAGLPSGERFDPDELKRVSNRLTRTGAFSSVTLREAETPNADGTLDIELTVTDAKPRRFGFGAELSSLEGLTLSTFWLHRNVAGGAERFRIDAEVSDISNSVDGIDASITARLEVPGAVGPDTDAYFQAAISREREPAYDLDSLELAAGLTRRYNEDLTAEIGIGYQFSKTKDDLGTREFHLVTLPLSLTYDKRDNDLDPRNGYYISADATPFADVAGDGGSGLRLYGDLRGYYGLGEADRTVLAGRLQIGSVIGPSITETQPDFLFYSGGAGTVRGQPYQSLDIDLGGGISSGGLSFIGFSGEIRQDVGKSFGVVAFADIGYVGEDQVPGSNGDWHAGAGLGVRYQTGLGPLRFDVAAPVGGDTGKGVQIYLGIGQSF
ncbi:autotransporter assembly complex protein TamA [Salipiger sp.]|uniref:autotransporter assembly complex protein TamA n=1 Tax=Salipiger sp. TaxID=2078585 RepID=UPI003A978784